jgi:hypothetical protein
MVWPTRRSRIVRSARIPLTALVDEVFVCSSRRLVLNIIQTLAAHGWMLHISCDLTKRASDKDTLFFQACPPVTVCLLFRTHDSRLLNHASSGRTFVSRSMSRTRFGSLIHQTQMS